MTRGPLRRAAKRDTVEPAIVEALRDAGYLVTEAGWLCDLMVFDPNSGRVTLIEVKTGKAKLRPSQQAVIAQGWPVKVVRSVEGAFAAVF